MENEKKLPLSLYGFSPEMLSGILGLAKPFYGRQIYKWLIRGASSFDQMTDLPKLERQRLSEMMPSFSSSTVETTETDESGASKLGIKLFDGSIIECVLLIDSKGRHTACLSSQVGCAMGCTFCRTGTMGLKRNLTAEEIIEQYIHLTRVSDEPITHIVYMGMGEPLANIAPVTRSIRYFHEENGFNISLRRITISTCGVVPGILKLSEQKLPVKLAVSLVSADNRTRSRVMPINETWDLPELKKALLRYQRTGGKRFTLEYCLLHNVNTDESAAKKLATYVREMDVVVNLIPWNPAEGLPYETPSEQEIDSFAHYLDRMNIKFTRRYSRGREINGACGQLAVPLNKGFDADYDDDDDE
ncbi:23S rRNA m2A2503 methyltransferase [Sphaerochaeta pleomorpha str. Grapes]|uniref:23S rRNA m2A2503 methyltransferase n=1 Tax=Sphaerochaeta pleomorpha (strain ATCC BAA-1885 / DSM 22778 / Grapes) TaxID=158190 RepID=G8QVD9_SPHPG|nr:23S rRNA (adenine(2503)-C(2))-methyltransferase RlmN [Sphaerochaeta pleomorpha]AEV30454.1 23S rRNA m2A2503 methyltransferase [Sphaerochaeta pleomorpha str. Grapes]